MPFGPNVRTSQPFMKPRVRTLWSKLRVRLRIVIGKRQADRVQRVVCAVHVYGRSDFECGHVCLFRFDSLMCTLHTYNRVVNHASNLNREVVLLNDQESDRLRKEAYDRRLSKSAILRLRSRSTSTRLTVRPSGMRRRKRRPLVRRSGISERSTRKPSKYSVHDARDNKKDLGRCLCQRLRYSPR